MTQANRVGLVILGGALVAVGYCCGVAHRVPGPAAAPAPAPPRPADPGPTEVTRRSRGNGLSLWFGDEVAALVRYPTAFGVDDEDPAARRAFAPHGPGDLVALLDDSVEQGDPSEAGDDVILAADHAALVEYHSPVPDEAGRFQLIRRLALARRLFTVRRGAMVRVLSVADAELPDGLRAVEVEVDPRFKRGWVAHQYIR